MAQTSWGNETVDDAHNTQLSEAQREAHLLAALRPMAATLPESGIMAVSYTHLTLPTTSRV